jgi:methionyl-tRNA synthetase
VKYKNDVDAAAVGVRAGINLAAVFGIIAQPIIPDAAKKILDALGIPEANRKMPGASKAQDFAALLDAIPRGHLITPPDVLFQKIEDTQVAEWTERFGGG